MDKFWENYIKTRPANSKGAFDAFRKMSQEPRTMAQSGGSMPEHLTKMKPKIDDNFWINHYRQVIDARLGAMEEIRKRGGPLNPDDAEYLFKQYNELKKYGGDTPEFDQRIKNLSPSAEEPEFAAHGGRIGFQGGLAVTGYKFAKPFINPFIKKYLPEIGALGTSGAFALRNLFKDDEEVSEDLGDQITTKVEKDAGGTEPPEDPWDPNKLLEILESTTYNIAENRVKRKAWNYVEKKINERAIELGKKYPNDPIKRRDTLGKEFNEYLGKNIDVSGVKKDGTISYRKGWKEGYPRSTGLISVVDERETARITEEKPFRDQGYVPTKEFIKIL